METIGDLKSSGPHARPEHAPPMGTLVRLPPVVRGSGGSFSLERDGMTYRGEIRNNGHAVVREVEFSFAKLCELVRAELASADLTVQVDERSIVVTKGTSQSMGITVLLDPDDEGP